MATAPELLPYGRIREDLFRPLSGVSRNYIVATIIAFIVASICVFAFRATVSGR